MKRIFTLLSCITFPFTAMHLAAQNRIVVSGTVFDTSKVYAIPDVKVFSTSGASGVTDSLGSYTIRVNPEDSIYFYYNDKNSVKYPVKNIYDLKSFDIAIHAKARSRYKVLPDVTVFSDTYRRDSVENRERYAKIFGSTRPALGTSMGDNGVPGLDIGSLVGIFQFRKNKQRQAFHDRLMEQERDGYVDYRFNAKLINRMTGLSGKNLDDYMVVYRPSYEFVAYSTLVEFYQYIIDSAAEFKKRFRIE